MHIVDDNISNIIIEPDQYGQAQLFIYKIPLSCKPVARFNNTLRFIGQKPINTIKNTKLLSKILIYNILLIYSHKIQADTYNRLFFCNFILIREIKNKH